MPPHIRHERRLPVMERVRPFDRRAASIRRRSSRPAYDQSAVAERIALAVCAGCGARDECLRETLAEEREIGRCDGLTAAQRQARRESARAV